MTLSMRGHHIYALPNALGQIAVLALPALPGRLHQRLERVRQARQVCLCGRKRRQGHGRIPGRECGEHSGGFGVRVRGRVGGR